MLIFKGELNFTLLSHEVLTWQLFNEGNLADKLVHAPRNAKEISCLHTTEIKKKYVETSIFLSLLRRSAKKLPKEERLAKMKNIIIIVISTTRPN